MESKVISVNTCFYRRGLEPLGKEWYVFYSKVDENCWYVYHLFLLLYCVQAFLHTTHKFRKYSLASRRTIHGQQFMSIFDQLLSSVASTVITSVFLFSHPRTRYALVKEGNTWAIKDLPVLLNYDIHNANPPRVDLVKWVCPTPTISLATGADQVSVLPLSWLSPKALVYTCVCTNISTCVLIVYHLICFAPLHKFTQMSNEYYVCAFAQKEHIIAHLRKIQTLQVFHISTKFTP
jgi:hypothetical protein